MIREFEGDLMRLSHPQFRLVNIEEQCVYRNKTNPKASRRTYFDFTDNAVVNILQRCRCESLNTEASYD